MTPCLLLTVAAGLVALSERTGCQWFAYLSPVAVLAAFWSVRR